MSTSVAALIYRQQQPDGTWHRAVIVSADTRALQAKEERFEKLVMKRQLKGLPPLADLVEIREDADGNPVEKRKVFFWELPNLRFNVSIALLGDVSKAKEEIRRTMTMLHRNAGPDTPPATVVGAIAKVLHQSQLACIERCPCTSKGERSTLKKLAAKGTGQIVSAVVAFNGPALELPHIFHVRPAPEQLLEGDDGGANQERAGVVEEANPFANLDRLFVTAGIGAREMTAYLRGRLDVLDCPADGPLLTKAAAERWMKRIAGVAYYSPDNKTKLFVNETIHGVHLLPTPKIRTKVAKTDDSDTFGLWSVSIFHRIRRSVVAFGHRLLAFPGLIRRTALRKRTASELSEGDEDDNHSTSSSSPSDSVSLSSGESTGSTPSLSDNDSDGGPKLPTLGA